MNLPHELHDLCSKGFVTLGLAGRIVRFSTAKMMDRPIKGMIREGVEALFYDVHLVEDDDVENTKNAVSNMSDALDAVDDLIAAGFQIDAVSGLMMMSVGLTEPGVPYTEAATWATIWRDVPADAETDWTALWEQVEAIIKPWGGEVHEAGPIRSDQAPHWHIMADGFAERAA